MPGGNYTSLPVSVPVGYGESGMLQASPQMAHQNISPRPSSSETDSGKIFFKYKKNIFLNIKNLISFQFIHLDHYWKCQMVIQIQRHH